MEDNLFSLSCPNCGNSLFEVAIFNPMFLHKADCPYCGQSSRWARMPITLMLSGLIMVIVSSVCLIKKFKIPVLYVHLPALALGLGAGCFLFGFMFLRFIAVSNEKEKLSHTSDLMGHIC